MLHQTLEDELVSAFLAKLHVMHHGELLSPPVCEWSNNYTINIINIINFIWSSTKHKVYCAVSLSWSRDSACWGEWLFIIAGRSSMWCSMWLGSFWVILGMSEGNLYKFHSSGGYMLFFCVVFFYSVACDIEFI